MCEHVASGDALTGGQLQLHSYFSQLAFDHAFTGSITFFFSLQFDQALTSCITVSFSACF